MNRLKRLFIVIILIIAGQSAIATEAEVGGMFNLNVNKKFNDYFFVSFQNHLWLDHNFTKMERYMIGANLKTTLVKKHLFFDAYYYYRYRNITGSENTHRYQFGLSGGYALPKVKFSAVSKMESNHIFMVSKEHFNNTYYWRNRLSVIGILKNNNKVSPFGAVEVFNKMNWRKEFNKEHGYINKKGVELIWIDLGVDYKINDTFSLTFIVKEQLNLFIQRYSTMFGVACSVNL